MLAANTPVPVSLLVNSTVRQPEVLAKLADTIPGELVPLQVPSNGAEVLLPS